MGSPMVFLQKIAPPYLAGSVRGADFLAGLLTSGARQPDDVTDRLRARSEAAGVGSHYI